jgi:hypothetical protein
MPTPLDKLKRTKWFRTRPLVVQKAHEIWSPGDGYLVNDKLVYLIGFTETEESDKSGDPHDLMLILSDIDPCVDYDGAVAKKFNVCAKHFKQQSIQ